MIWLHATINASSNPSKKVHLVHLSECMSKSNTTHTYVVIVSQANRAAIVTGVVQCDLSAWPAGLQDQCEKKKYTFFSQEPQKIDVIYFLFHRRPAELTCYIFFRGCPAELTCYIFFSQMRSLQPARFDVLYFLAHASRFQTPDIFFCADARKRPKKWVDFFALTRKKPQKGGSKIFRADARKRIL